MKKTFAIVGGGSVNWCPTLIRDIYHIACLEGGEFRLLDPDEPAVKLIASLEPLYNRISGKEFRFVPVQTLDEAVAGADFTLCTFSPGSLSAYYYDLEVPIAYGVRQPVSMTVGPCAISAAMRTCPVANEVAQAVEKHAPGSWILNVTNPMSCVTRALNLGVETVKVIGLCHELEGEILFVGDVLGVPKPKEMRTLDYIRQAFDLQVGGLNHFIWITRLFVHGRDRYDDLRAFADTHEAWYPGGDPSKAETKSSWGNNKEAKLEMCRAFRHMPMAGDRHLIEFFPGFCNAHNRFGQDYGVRKTTMRERFELKAKATERVRRWVAGEEQVPWMRSSEQTADIIETVLTGGRARFNMNLPNRGQIDNVPAEAVVESISEVSAEGLHPLHVGPLPEPVGAIVRNHVAAQELTVQAALEGSRKKMLDAMYVDPLCGQVEFRNLPKLADELLEANREFLPRVFG
ncbi:MAG: alpha-glucosidase/alpha-galactosidase [Fimbriimonadales bacterium]